jgi:hypothetical protein
MKIRKNFFIVLSLLLLLFAGLYGCDNGTASADKHLKRTVPAEEIMEMLHDLCDIAGYGIHSGANYGE